MSERPMMMFAGPIVEDPFPSSRLAEARSAVARAATDFNFVWDCEGVEVTAVGTYADQPVATISYQGSEYIVR